MNTMKHWVPGCVCPAITKNARRDTATLLGQYLTRECETRSSCVTDSLSDGKQNMSVWLKKRFYFSVSKCVCVCVCVGEHVRLGEELKKVCVRASRVRARVCVRACVWSGCGRDCVLMRSQRRAALRPRRDARRLASPIAFPI